MERAPDRVMQYLVEVEEAAEEILSDRQQIIDLDRRRNKTREAIRAVTNDKEHQKLWVCTGDMFLRLPKENTHSLLNKDFDQLNREINQLQKNLKPKVNRLRDLEHKEELKGFNLQPLSRDELNNIADMT